MSPMPLPVRVAAGLVVIALEQVRKVPEQLAELPVTAASRAVQAGMRVQQQVTRLAIKGDEVFALFQPVQDTPPWARFDEDDDETGDARRPPSHRPVAADRARPGTARDEPVAIPGYDELSLAQLRAKLRALSLRELESLLQHEHAHQDRAPFVTMLSNRISTVRAR